MLDLVNRALTIAATALSLFVAVTQITSVGRLRRAEAFWKAAGEAEVEERAAITRSLRRTATAELLARSAVPVTEFIIPSLLLAFFTFLFGTTGYETGRYLSGETKSLSDDPIATVFGLLIVFSFAFSAISIFSGIYDERRRISIAYRRGDPFIDRRFSVFKLGIRERGGFDWKVHGRRLLLLAGLAYLFFMSGLTYANPSGLASYRDETKAWLPIVTLFVATLTVMMAGSVGMDLWRDRRLDLDSWRHPECSGGPASDADQRSAPLINIKPDKASIASEVSKVDKDQAARDKRLVIMLLAPAAAVLIWSIRKR